MFLKIDSFSFINSPVEDVRKYSREVACGNIKESVINEKFMEIQSRKYSEKEAVGIIQKLTISKNIVHSKRIDYQVPCGEAIIYLTNFITVEGSYNMKLLYALFDYLVDFKKDEDTNKNIYFLSKRSCKEIYPEVSGRIKFLSEKEKKSELAQEIENLYKILTAKH